MLFRALTQSIQIIGEAAARLDPQVKRLHADAPWRAIVGMRNRLVHAYFDIDPNCIWQTANEEVPWLARRLRRILGEEAAEPDEASS